MDKILVTGCAGFIGSHLTDRLLSGGYLVIGIDNFNDYYNPEVKKKNLETVKKNDNFKLYREDILNVEKLKEIFKKEELDKVVHLAARAGVRPSIKNPELYAKVNVLGTVNLLKLSVDYGIGQFIFGSSSSVYGDSKRLPFTEDDPCDVIISPYGASKRAAEFWVETFSRTYGLKSTILRLFTVYGPRGRPDMAPALFTKAILSNQNIHQFGNGTSSRDYTFIDDVVDGIIRTLDHNFDFEIINLGNDNPVSLNEFIELVEKLTKRKAILKHMPNQVGDVRKTWADISSAKRLIDWEPQIRIEVGMKNYLNSITSSNA